MKQLSAALATSLADCATVCTLVKLTLLGGRVVALADHDKDLVVAGVRYESTYAFEVSSVSIASGTQNSSLELSLLMDDAICSRADILSGAFDRAKCEVMLVDYAHTDNGAGLYYAGRVQQTSFADAITATLQIASLLDQNVNCASEQYSYTCTADLGDARCKVDLSGRKKTFAVGAVASRQSFTTDLTDDDKAWNGGLVAFTSGPNEGFAIEVGAYSKSNGGVVLKLPFPYALSPGDTGEIFPGCDKTPATCLDTYNNMPNYRGVPIGSDPALSGLTSAEGDTALPANQQPPGKVGYFDTATSAFGWYGPTALPALSTATSYKGTNGMWVRRAVNQYPKRPTTSTGTSQGGFNTYNPFGDGTSNVVVSNGSQVISYADAATYYGAKFNFNGFVDVFVPTQLVKGSGT